MNRIDYNVTVDFANPNNNIPPEYPLMQGSNVAFVVTLKENGVPIDLTNFDIVAHVVNFNKLDCHSTVLASFPPLTVEKLNDYTVRISGEDLSKYEYKCALVLECVHPGYSLTRCVSCPLYYIVQSNLI